MAFKYNSTAVPGVVDVESASAVAPFLQPSLSSHPLLCDFGVPTTRKQGILPNPLMLG